MKGDIDIPVVYVRWNFTIIPKLGYLIGKFDSANFTFQKREWRLSYDMHESFFCLYLYTVETPWPLASPFNVTVRLENEWGAKMNETTYDVKSTCTCIWKRLEDDIEQADPRPFTWNSIRGMTFLVILKEKSSPQTAIKSVSTQTECMPSGTNSSVQTPLYISTFPCLESLSEDFAKLLEQESVPDVEFQAADGQTTKAHKTVLCARSPVLASMLQSDMVEGKTGTVNVPDMATNILQQFLRYLYTGTLEELTVDTAICLYEAGDKYAVNNLARRCSEFLIENLTKENACNVLSVADAHSDSKFVEAVIAYILENGVPLSDGWSAFCDTYPKLAIKVLNHHFKVVSK